LFEEVQRLSKLPKGDHPSVTILRNHRCDLTDSRDKPGWSACNVYEVAERVAADGKVTFPATGKRFSLGTPDLIVNCDGANSVMREQAGIPRTHVSQATRFIAASIAATEITEHAPHGGVARRRYAELTNPKDGSLHGVRQVVLGSTTTPRLWVLVEVPLFVDLGNKEAVANYFHHHAALVVGRPLLDARITWGPNAFTMQQFISASAVKGENVIFAGDAVGNAHFLTSGGVMTATVPHVFALEKLLANLADGVPRTRALDRYNKWTLMATKAWLKLGFKEFGRQGEHGDTFEAAMADALERLRTAGGAGR
ncbi:MAG TPA: FAD-dependent monooxygenase, partial [Myxococcota bacterium]|nr:FAD-dependent monooxygenase [Myxococcota bacterium]